MQKWLKFDDLDAAIALNCDNKLFDALDVVFAHKNFTLFNNKPTESFASVTYRQQKYEISSPFMDKTLTFDDPVNTLCSLVVEIAWAGLRQNSQHLCFHGAAFELAGRLVVFPSTRKSGKSTLSVALMAAGHQLFTDDFLPISVANDGMIQGVGQGISPRLRLPMPAQIGGNALEFVKNRGYIANKQYRYIQPQKNELAKSSQSKPIGALVFLEYSEINQPKLTDLAGSDVLKALIKQNFSRSMNSEGILKILATISQDIPAYKLEYGDIPLAIACLEGQFNSWNSEKTVLRDQIDHRFDQAPDAVLAPKIDLSKDISLIQSPSITEVVSDGQRFLSGSNGRNILFLNEGATTIWRLLAEPATPSEVIEMMLLVFLDQKLDQIKKDVSDTLKSFISEGLIVAAPENCKPTQNSAIMGDVRV